MAAGQDYALGGMQLPCVVEKAGFTYFNAANIATAAYALLTIGNANTLLKCGTREQIDTYLRPMLEGRFFWSHVPFRTPGRLVPVRRHDACRAADQRQFPSVW